MLSGSFVKFDIFRFVPSDVDMHVLLDPMPSYLLSSSSPDARNACCALLAALMDVSAVVPYVTNVVEGVVSSVSASSVAAAAALLTAISSSDAHAALLDRLASHVIAMAASHPDSASLDSLKVILTNSTRVAKSLIDNKQFVAFAQCLVSSSDAR